MIDLMVALREYVAALGMKPACDVGRSVERDALAAVTELERRARIEARRDAKSGPRYSTFHSPPKNGDPEHVVCIGGTVGRGPDYWTALEAALTAAGAP
jgi:hypothetical protein